jgi:hypothetical protein
MEKTKTLKELINNLSPYFLSLAIDQENDFTPYISILLPVKWKIFKNVDYIMESFAYSDAAHRYHFYLRNTKEGDFDEMVEFLLSIIEWNHEYEEKMKVLEVEKAKFLEEQEAKLREMEESILPKPLSLEATPENSTVLTNPSTEPKTVDEYSYADEIEEDLEPAIQDFAPRTPISEKYGSKVIVVEEDNGEDSDGFLKEAENFPSLVDVPIRDGDILDEYDPEEDARINEMVNKISKGNIMSEGTR